MNHTAALRSLLSDDPLRLKALHSVAQLNLPDCWIAAGFIRDAVWDHRHRFPPSPPVGDVDVVWFDRATATGNMDRHLEDELRSRTPDLAWSVKNQADMHRRNGDRPYRSVADAMSYWPETATAVAARVLSDGFLDIIAPFGLGDLFALRLRPNPAFSNDRLPLVRERLTSKRWLQRYPLLTLTDRLRD